jgi:hypothetical protein
MAGIILIIGAIFIFVVIVNLLIWVFNNEKTLSKFSSAKIATTIDAKSTPVGKKYNYTYSIWVYIDDWSYNFGKEKIIFSKGTMSPKVSLGATENNLKVSLQIDEDGTSGIGDVMTQFDCGVDNVPLQKWTNILISVNGRTLDIYINGKLVRTCVMNGVPSYDMTSPTFLTPNGGFDGFTSKFKFWSEEINPQQAWNIYQRGPGGNIFGNLFSEYKLQVNFMRGGDTKATVSI